MKTTQLPRRDVLKAVAMLAATPFVPQTGGGTQVPASRPGATV